MRNLCRVQKGWAYSGQVLRFHREGANGRITLNQDSLNRSHGFFKVKFEKYGRKRMKITLHLDFN